MCEQIIKVSLCALPRAFVDICLGHSVDLHCDRVRQETRETRLEDADQVGEEKTEDEDNLQSSRDCFDDFLHG